MVKNSMSISNLINSSFNQFVIPIFQRTYKWDKKDCKYFFDTLILDKNPYVSEVKIYPNNHDDSVYGQSLIIDGQQRITTFSLLVLAICAYCKKNHFSDFNWEEDLYYRFIINRRFQDYGKYRLKLQEQDNLSYIKCADNLLDDISFDSKVKSEEDCCSNIIPMYNYFVSLIDESNISLVYKRIQTVSIMYSELEEHDNLRRIFYASNNAGKDLSLNENVKAILIYGYSKDDESQNMIYDKYWRKLEDYFLNIKQTTLFNVFLTSYAQYKTNDFHKQAFSYFSNLQDCSVKCEETLKELSDYFTDFKKIYEADFDDESLSKIVQFLNPYLSSFLFTLLIKISKLSDENILQNFKLIESHIFRNSLTNSDNSDTIRRVFNLNEFENCWDLTDVIYNQIRYSDYFVDDLTFRKGFLEHQYSDENKNQRKEREVLVRIVQEDSGDEDFNYNNTSLEHILPRKPKELPKNLTEQEYLRVVRTFKNATLLPRRYNSKLGRKTFREKRDMVKGYKDSKMEINAKLSTFEDFGLVEMQEWGNYLFEKALKIWSFPLIQQSKLI